MHEGERPLVWFSLRQHWDPIANALDRAASGRALRLSFEHTVSQGRGVWRFGYPAAELLPWRQAVAQAGMSRETVRALERDGRKAGSDPALWLAALEAVPIDRCIIEHLHGDHWCGADHGH